MPEIIVGLHEPSEQGRLYYLRDSGIEGDILFIQNKQRRRMCYSVNLDGGGAILSFDVERLLTDVEFIYRWSAWHRVPYLESPQAERAANLVLVGVQLEASKWEIPTTKIRGDNVLRYYYQYDPGVRATTNADYSCVQFLFGASEPISEWIALSHQCLR